MADGLSPAQIRGARGMLGWSMVDLSKAAHISVSTVKRVEGCEAAAISAAMVGRVRQAFEAAGMQFLDDQGDGAGMRLRPRQVSPFSRLL